MGTRVRVRNVGSRVDSGSLPGGWPVGVEDLPSVAVAGLGHRLPGILGLGGDPMQALVVASEGDVQVFLSEFLRQHRCSVSVAGSWSELVSVAGGLGVLDLALVDLDLPSEVGLRSIEWLRARFPGARLIAIAGRASVHTVVQAVHLGAQDVVPDPAADVLPLSAAVARALETRLKGGDGEDVAQLAARVGMVLGTNPTMWKLAALAVRVARHPFPVLLVGETGSGKEVFARLIHAASPRASGPFIDLNCGAIPPELQLSELFSHQEGAFTGARQTRRGVFELANGGTLFLDEIASAPHDVQVSLLRVLETSTFRRVGGEQNIRVDVRLVAATNIPLEDLVQQGRFRQDLYFRLDVVSLRIPPLRERPEDIPLLAEYFLRRALPPQLAERAALSPAAIDLICSYSWPGNVRELMNAMAHAAALTPDGIVKVEYLPPRLRAAVHGEQRPGAIEGGSPAWATQEPAQLAAAWADALLARMPQGRSLDLEQVLAQWEDAGLRVAMRLIRWAMAQTGGDREAAAQLLGIRPRTLRYLLSEKARLRARADGEEEGEAQAPRRVHAR